MKFEYIPEKEAPGAPVKLSKAAQEAAKVVEGLKTGFVAKIELDSGQKPQGIKTSLTRFAKSQNVKLDIWDGPEGGVVYVRKTK